MQSASTSKWLSEGTCTLLAALWHRPHRPEYQIVESDMCARRSTQHSPMHASLHPSVPLTKLHSGTSLHDSLAVLESDFALDLTAGQLAEGRSVLLIVRSSACMPAKTTNGRNGTGTSSRTYVQTRVGWPHEFSPFCPIHV